MYFPVSYQLKILGYHIDVDESEWVKFLSDLDLC